MDFMRIFKKMFFCLSAVLVLLGGSLQTEAAEYDTVLKFTLVNDTSAALTSFQLKYARERNWQMDVLANQPLAAGASRYIKVDGKTWVESGATDPYVFRAVLSDGTVITESTGYTKPDFYCKIRVTPECIYGSNESDPEEEDSPFIFQ